MDEKRIYCANGKKVDNYDLVNFALCLSKLPKELIYEFEGKKYINLTMGANKDVKYGKTHSVWVNEYKPEEKPQSKADELASRMDKPETETEDLF